MSIEEATRAQTPNRRWSWSSMITNTFLDYVTIRLSISALRLVAPASITYLLCCSTVKPEWWYAPIGVFAAAEAGFYLLVYLPRTRRLQAPPTHPAPPLTRAQRQLIFTKCIEAGAGLPDPSDSHAQQHQPYPTGWFLPNPSPNPSDPKAGPTPTPTRTDMIDWLLWALFSSSREELGQAGVDEYADELDGYVREIEHVLGRELRDDDGVGVGAGSDGIKGMKSMRITLDPVRMLHRPLVWYFIVCAVDTYTTLRLLSLGFTHYTPGFSFSSSQSRAQWQWSLCFPPRPVLSFLSLLSLMGVTKRERARERAAPEGVALPYWYRPHKSKTKMPVVFLHGIGIGLYPYIPFIRSLISGSSPKSGSATHTHTAAHDEDEEDDNDNDNQDGQIGILLPELLPISMHMTPRSVPPRAVMLASLEIILGSLSALEEGGEGSVGVRGGEAGRVAGRGRGEGAEVEDEALDGEAGMRRPLLSNSTSNNGHVDFGSCSTLGNGTTTGTTTTTPSSSTTTTASPADTTTADTRSITGDTRTKTRTGWHRVVLAAHSYGTFVAGWIVRQCVDEGIVDAGSGVSGSGSSRENTKTHPPTTQFQGPTTHTHTHITTDDELLAPPPPPPPPPLAMSRRTQYRTPTSTPAPAPTQHQERPQPHSHPLPHSHSHSHSHLHPQHPHPHPYPLPQSSSRSNSPLCHKIAHLILIDPIPILLSHPAVAHNFLYRHPSSVCPRVLGSASQEGVGVGGEVDVDVDRGVGTGESIGVSMGMGMGDSNQVNGEGDAPFDVERGTGAGAKTGLPITTPVLAHAHAPDTAPSSGSVSGSGSGSGPGSLPAQPKSPSGSVKKSKSAKKSWFPFSYSSAAAWQLYYFASRDADVARTLCRAFFWAEGGIWREEVGVFMRGSSWGSSSGPGLALTSSGHERVEEGDRDGAGEGEGSASRMRRRKKREGGGGRGRGRGRNVTVVLGGMDQIVPAEAIRRYLTREARWSERWVGGVSEGEHGDGDTGELEGKLEVLFNPALDHAVIFDHEKWTEPLLEVVRRYVGDV